MLKFFGKKRDGENWSEIHRTTDLWEAEVVRTALLNEGVKANVKSIKGEEKGTQQNIVSVLAEKVTEAQMIASRALLVVSKKEEIMAAQAEQEESESKGLVEDYSDEGLTPTVAEPTSEPVTISEKDGVGIILYYQAEDVYELRLDMGDYKGAHFMSAEEWEDFIDFSAQRQEFFILLKEKYPKLAAFVKENKRRPDLLKLIEYSYGKSQPPKK